MRIVALIPARAGSKRIPGKNTKLLGGKPLIAWTIEAAKEAGIFDGIYVCSDDLSVPSCGATFLQREPAGDAQPDIEWVSKVLQIADVEAFAILRPTSPFRTANTIRRALKQFQEAPCSSIRAVEPVKQHPGKMWQWFGFQSAMTPYVEGYAGDGTPWHSMPTQSLQPVYIQNSSLEIAWAWCVHVFGTISGPKVAPFLTEGWEGFSIDYPDDWDRAERHAQELLAGVPTSPAA